MFLIATALLFATAYLCSKDKANTFPCQENQGLIVSVLQVAD